MTGKTPFLDINKDVKFTFYCLIITECDEDHMSFGTQELMANLTGYATNEWVFRSYLRYYENLLNHATAIMTTFTDMTYKEFQNEVKKNFDVEITENNFIDMDSVDLIQETIYYTGLMAESMHDYDVVYDDLDNMFIPFLFEGYELLNLDNGEYFTEEFSLVSRLIKRICKLYIPIVKLLDSCGCDNDEWFSELPDNVKVNMTKEANFPSSLEDLSWYDIVSYPYLLYYFITEAFGYTGSPEDG